MAESAPFSIRTFKALITNVLHYLNYNYELPVIINLLHYKDWSFNVGNNFIKSWNGTHVHSIIIKHL